MDSGLIYVLEGYAEYRIGSRKFSAGKDDIFYLSQDELYQIDVIRTPYRFFVVNFTLDKASRTVFSSDVCWHDSSVLLPYFERLFTCFTAQAPQYLISAKAELYSLILRLTANSRKYVPSSKYAFIETAISYMKSHADDPRLTISDVAASVFRSEGYFRRVFFECRGISPVRFLKNYRISVAKELLSQTDMSVTKVAAASGFSSVYYFCEVFHDVVGVSPKQWAASNKLV